MPPTNPGKQSPGKVRSPWKWPLLGFSTISLCLLILISDAGNSATLTPSPNGNDRNPVEGSTAALADEVYRSCNLSSKGLDREVLALGLRGFDRLAASGKVSQDSILTIVDFSKPSLDRRMYVIDLKRRKLLFQTVVAHGRNSGTVYARNFSNRPQSLQSSLGFYITRGTYQGGNGYSLLLDGCEKGFNDKARERAIVLHGADYAEETLGNSLRGYLGRSFGCPAVPMSIHRELIDKIKLGNPIFLYYPDDDYLQKSRILNG
jgi:hypothetical protein